MSELLDELRNRQEFPWNVPDWLDLDGLIAALERAERNEAVMRAHKAATFEECACRICSRVRELDALADAPEGSDGE